MPTDSGKSNKRTTIEAQANLKFIGKQYTGMIEICLHLAGIQ